ncbi:hypothetical protein LTR84_002128 [Exophiala bonariae]|uniref:BZIP domain-containing protein n=1 Tax=Exophiala bonariae TaxID=1690606 RepID=A0AAV9NE26_9EURO|nr:hypothetical protein LTR84_002128 [Exophiala bonariae]
MPDPLVPPFVFARSNPYYMLNSKQMKRHRRNLKRDERRKRETLAVYSDVLAAYGDALHVAHRNTPGAGLDGLLSVWNKVLQTWNAVAGQVESGRFREIDNDELHENADLTIEPRDNENGEFNFNFNENLNGNAEENDDININNKENAIIREREEDMSPAKSNKKDVQHYNISVLNWLRETEQAARPARQAKVEKYLAGEV